MATSLLPSGGIALFGAPDTDIGSRIAKTTNVQAMHLDLTHDIVDDLLESLRSGKPPQIFFGRTPQLKYGDKTLTLQSTSETARTELYHSTGTGSDDDDDLAFTSLIKHSLVAHKAENVTAGVDSALEQLKNSMAAVKEMKEANKTIVGSDMRNAGHRRVPSKGFVPSHLAPSGRGSPLLSVPSSPMAKKPPTSQPGGANQAILTALRVPIIHLLAMQPAKESHLAQTCRTSVANVRDLLPKIAKHAADDADKWQLTDKSFREIDPYRFPYKTQEDREQAINSAIKSFDRLRLSKEDKLWQILLPREERGKGKCLSRLNVKAVEKSQKPSTPLHKMPKLGDKKPAAKKTVDKDAEKKAKDVDAKPKKAAVKDRALKPLREPAPSKSSPLPAKNSHAPAATSTPKPSATAPPNRIAPPADANKIRPKKVAPSGESSSPRVKPKMASRDLQQTRPFRPTKPVNTKPKNPSPLSASPPVNASDFEDSHPVHKALSGAPSPAKNTSGNSDRLLKRKANDLDSDIHSHNLAVKKPHIERSAPSSTPASGANGRANGSTPSVIKRRPDVPSTSSTPATKVRRVGNIDTARASRYPQSTQLSPGDSSSSQTSPTMPSLSFRQTVELSQRFQKYYKKYETLYWKLTESVTPPTQSQRDELLRMHKKLEEMKREIKAGAGAHR